MDKFEAMQRFLRVAELTSFTQAAESLGLPKASVSASVQWLENHLGTRLLHRSTRRVTLTQDGQWYLAHARQLLAELDDLEGEFQRTPEDITGTLRVDMPSRFASTVVLPKLPEFFARYPKLRLELSTEDRRVDVISGGFDCVVRVGYLQDSSLIAKPLATFHVSNCASPAYIKQYGTPKTLADLQSHRLIHYSAKLGARPEGFEYVDAQGKVQSMAMPGAITVNGTDAYLAACLAGLGIAQIPLIGIRQYLAQGTLVHLLPEYTAEAMPVNLVYASRRNPSRRIQCFMEWLQGLLN